jgi:hypothetical protein
MDLTPEEALLAAMLRRAIKDAQDAKGRVREHAPIVAEWAKLVTPTNNTQRGRLDPLSF